MRSADSEQSPMTGACEHVNGSSGTIKANNFLTSLIQAFQRIHCTTNLAGWLVS